MLDAGAFVAVERADRVTITRIEYAPRQGVALRTTAIVLGQVWRDPSGRQARLARLVRAVDVVPVDESLGRRAGILLGRTGTADPIDATVVLIAEDGDSVLTSDADDLALLANSAGLVIDIIAC